MLATVVATLAVAGAAPAPAAQATGDDVPTWSPGWSWTYQTSFRYRATGTDVTLNETVTYTVAGIETFAGQSAYRLNIAGTITGGGGTAEVEGTGTVNLNNFSGSVSGTRIVRRSDLALLQESQRQNLNGRGSLGIISTGITAVIDLNLNPRTGWEAVAFPVEAGQSWTNDVDIDYTGGFTYSSSLASGASDFDGVFVIDAPANVTDASIGVPIGTVATRRVHSQTADAQTVNTHWYSPVHRNDAQEYLQLPIDGGSLTLDRKLASASTPAPSAGVTATITPSLTCAGGEVAVTGRASSGAAGVPVSISLDKSPVSPGATVSANATTVTGGNYSAVLTAPAEADTLAKVGARATWGVIVTAGTAVTTTTLVVGPRNCTALTYLGDTSTPQGGTATVRARLTDLTGASTAGRTVTFTLSGGATATAVADAAGIATAQLAVAGPPRSATLTASSAATATLEAASVTTAFAVATIPTTTTVVADPATVTVGDPVRFVATVAPGLGSLTPGGTVQFVVDGSSFGPAVPLAGGSATSPALSTLPLGNHDVVAVYSGSSDHAPSTSAAVTFRVREPLKATSTALVVTPGSAVYGQSVDLDATVTTATETPTGEVVFTAGGTEVARAGLAPDGTASVTVADLPVGTLPIVATYSGDDVFAASASAPRSLVVAKAAVQVELSTGTATAVTGQSITPTVTVAAQSPGGGTPDGMVQLLVDGQPVGSSQLLVNGAASFAPLTDLRAGPRTIAVAYAGSGRYLAGSDQASLQVEPAATTTAVTVSPSPSVQEQLVRISATVAAQSPGSGAATGTVSFFAGADLIGAAPLVAGPGGTTATLELDDLAPGDYLLTARYAGDGDYLASTSAPVSHTVIAGTAVVATETSLTASTNPSVYGRLIGFTATVRAADGSTPRGAVQFSVDGTDVGDPVPLEADGTASSPTLASPDPGDHTVIAAFVAEPGFTGSGAILTQTVAAAGVQVQVTSSRPDAEVAQAITYDVEVVSTSLGTDTPTGFVQFSVDGRPRGDAVALVDGRATSPSIEGLSPGTHRISALYSGDVRFLAGLGEVVQTVARVATTTGLALDRSSVTYGDDVVATATVTPASSRLGAPTGPVTFLVDGAEVATVPLSADAAGNGTATVRLPGLTAGSHRVRAVYAATATFDASSSGLRDVTVAKRATQTSAAAAAVSLTPLGLPLGQLRAKVTAGSAGVPLAGVPVVFKVGASTVCTLPTDATGSATCNAAAQLLALVLNGGYTATFAGDANHLSSTARGALLK